MRTEELHRYSRQLVLPELGAAGQARLKAAKVLVVGAGGLGCPALLYLAAAGIGSLGIADSDTVDASNLHRQVLYGSADIGRPKTEAAIERLAAQYPFCRYAAHPRIGTENALAVFKDYDLVVDGSDNFASRYLVNDACVMLGKPLVFGAVFRFEGQVAVFNYRGSGTYRCLFPEPPPAEEVPNCSDSGVLGVLPGIIGVLQATEAIKIAAGIGEPLCNRILRFDALGMAFDIFNYAPVAANCHISALGDYESLCGVQEPEIGAAELKHKIGAGEALQLIDVRGPDEHEAGHIGGCNIPLAEIAARGAALDRSSLLVTYCQSGMRSRAAAKLLRGLGFSRVFSLKGGINAFL